MTAAGHATGAVSLNLASGGHLSHGMKLNASAIFYKPDHYELDPKTELIDFDRAIGLDPELAGTYADRGRVHELKADRDDAIADYRKALSLKSRGTYDDKAKAMAEQRLAALSAVNPVGGAEEVARQPEP